MPRVTEVLDYFATPGLVDWKVRVGKREANRISKQAMNIGTNVDEWVKAKVLGNKLPKLKTMEAETCVVAYKRWEKDYSPDLKVATRLYSDPYGITGEPDLYWGDVVVDLKCSSGIRDSYWLQTAAYCKMAGKTDRAILRLDKTLGEYEYKVKEGWMFDWEVFQGLLNAYRFFNPPTEGTTTKEVGHANKDRVANKEVSSRQILGIAKDSDDRASQGRKI
jgi:hypothetical protein